MPKGTGAGPSDDAAEERPRLAALVRLHRGLVRISRNGSNFPAGAEAMGRWPGTFVSGGPRLVLDDGVTPAVGAESSTSSVVGG